MKLSSILMAAALAFGVAGAPSAVNALDLGGSVDRASKSVSKAARSVTRSLSKTVGSTTKSVSNSVSKTVGSTTKSVTSATNSLTGESGGTGGEGSSGGTTVTIGVLSNYQLLSLGLESNPPTTGQAGTKVNPTYVRALVASLDGFERQELEIRCKSVLRSPQAYDRELILLCQILASI